MIPRIIEKECIEYLNKSNKILLIYGPRQAGKTTLAKKIGNNSGLKTLYISADLSKNEALLTQRDIKLYSELTEGYQLLIIDEAQRVRAKSIESSIREHRKHGLRFILSTQGLNGVESAFKDAVGLIASLCYFQCPESDAKHFSDQASGIVSPKEINALDKYEMFVRITSAQNVFKCGTTLFEKGDRKKVDYVINNSLKKYYIDTKKQNAKKKLAKPKTFKRKLTGLPKGLLDLANNQN